MQSKLLKNVLLTGAAFVAAFTLFQVSLPRNVRNNNPLNIKEFDGDKTEWEGEAVVDTDGTFEVFKDDKYGWRAAYIILLQYLERGNNTLNSIIETWAPPLGDSGEFENHTQAYIDYITQQTGIRATEQVKLEQLPVIMLAMSEFEGSKGHWNIDDVMAGVELAEQADFVIARLNRLSGVYA